MRSHPRAGALVFGILLIVVGTLFLLHNWYPEFSAWYWLGRYWPVLLIIIGLKKLYGHFSYRSSPPFVQNRPKE